VLTQFNFPYWVSKRGGKQAWYEIEVPVGQTQ
jgi:hypothetical protein